MGAQDASGSARILSVMTINPAKYRFDLLNI
jgi:hypothetical protein